ncbi:hypothetical protein G6F62_003120 [Rhizopus arrhizus]|nr:hypothetical protein G6F62_003120 [Rhizopus arrhizus]
MRSICYLLLFVGLARCQSIFDILNNTESSPVQWVSSFLTSSPEYQPIIDLLSQSTNLTLFIPSDQVLQALNATSSTANETTSTSVSSPTPSQTGGVTQTDALNGTRDYYTNPYIQDFNLTDIIHYHIVNQSIDIQASFNSTNATNSTEAYNATVLNTLVSNSTLDKLGTGVPLVLQRVPADNGSDTSSTTDDLMFNYTVGGSVEFANINTSQVIQASNGYVYLIDKVLVPPVNLSDTIEALVNATNITTPFTNLTESYNITQFEQLLTTLNSTNSSAFDSLTNTTNTTYFVPIDDAFQGQAEIDNQTIPYFLSAHVVQGIYYTSNITNTTELQSLAGTNITLATNGTGFSVNNASIIQPNILLDSGVLHLISGVLNYTTSANSTGVGGGISTTAASMSATPTNGGSVIAAPTTSDASVAVPTASDASTAPSASPAGSSGTPFPAPQGSHASCVSPSFSVIASILLLAAILD